MSQPQDSGAQRPFCRGPGCSFYGDAVTGYCSVCAKKNNVASVAQAPVPATTSLLSPPKASEPIAIRSPGSSSTAADLAASPSGASPSSATTAGTSLGTSPDKSSSLRCAMCNKKLGLTSVKCRCDQFFCNNHRYSDQHNCTFDYKSKGRDELAKANPVIVSPKLDKI